MRRKKEEGISDEYRAYRQMAEQSERIHREGQAGAVVGRGGPGW